jgi:hypothetical protein
VRALSGKEDEMSQNDGTTRREFTVASALAMLSGVVIMVSPSACGGGSSPSSPTPTPTPGPTPTPAATDKTGVVGSNHGHSATITAAQLAAPALINLDIRGSSDHPHTVTLTAAEVTSIAGGQRVSVESSADAAHSHTVTFN